MVLARLLGLLPSLRLLLRWLFESYDRIRTLVTMESHSLQTGSPFLRAYILLRRIYLHEWSI